MTLPKKQIYLNKVLSKHYKKLKYTFSNKTKKNIPALKTTAINKAKTQSILITILTIDTIHKDFPGAIDVTILNGLTKTKKAVLFYEGRAVVPTKFSLFITKLSQNHFCKGIKELENSKENTLFNRAQSKALSGIYLSAISGVIGKRVIGKILGARVRMDNFTLRFNSELSLEYFGFLKRKPGIKLKHLDYLASSLIPPLHCCGSEREGNTSKIEKEDIFKKKQITLSKMELSSAIAQVLHKIRFLKGQKSFEENLFKQEVSNLLGALVEINSKIYFISNKELKQCGIVGGFKHTAMSASIVNNTPKLKQLINSNITKDKTILLKTKCIGPNITFFNYLNIAARIYVMHNIKQIFSKLVNTLSFLVLKVTDQKKKL